MTFIIITILVEYKDFRHRHIEVDVDPYDAYEGSRHCRRVRAGNLIIDDNTIEEDEVFFIDLLDSFPPVRLAENPPGIAVTIIDDDGEYN